MPFRNQTIWLVVFNHQYNCLFCNFDAGQVTTSNRNSIYQPEVSSVELPKPYSSSLPYIR